MAQSCDFNMSLISLEDFKDSGMTQSIDYKMGPAFTEDSTNSTDVDSDDGFICIDTDQSPRFRPRVHFPDESLGSPLADIIEVASFKEFNYLSAADVARAERQWCSDLLVMLTNHNAEVQRKAVVRLEGAVVHLASSPEGAQVVQVALDVACRDVAGAMLASELRGHVMKLAACPRGSEILQTCLTVLPPSAVGFIVPELCVGAVSAAARSGPGHQLLCRILQCLPSVQTEPLIAELIMNAAKLSSHSLGSVVLEHALEYGSGYQRYCIYAALTQVMQIDHALSTSAVARRVMTKAYYVCSASQCA
jgi:hypothetical protein